MFSGPPPEPVSAAQCDCQSSGTAECPANAGGPRPSQWDSFTGDKLQNLTGRNMTDYLLKTYGKFIRKRYVIHVVYLVQRFSASCRGTKTKVISSTNEDRRKLRNEPIRTRSKFRQPAPSVGKRVRARHD